MKIHEYIEVPEVKCEATVTNCADLPKQTHYACEMSEEKQG